MSFSFDYQSKVWGTAIPSDSPYSLAGLRFHYFLPFALRLKGKLLEIGCGAGGNLVGLARYIPDLQLFGVDIGESAIAYGTKNFPQLSLEIGSAEHLPYPDDFFECVCFFDVLEHVEDPALCISEAVRVLKSGGVFHAYIPCEGELFSLHGFLNRCGINLKERTAGHIQLLTRQKIETLCADAGLYVVDTRWSCHLINQLGDLAYYLYLTISGKHLTESLESTMSQGDGRFLFGFLSKFKNLVSWVWYWESRIFWFLPGAGVHITGVKGTA